MTIFNDGKPLWEKEVCIEVEDHWSALKTGNNWNCGVWCLTFKIKCYITYVNLIRDQLCKVWKEGATDDTVLPHTQNFITIFYFFYG